MVTNESLKSIFSMRQMHLREMHPIENELEILLMIIGLIKLRGILTQTTVNYF
jgi:hypothetical protein